MTDNQPTASGVSEEMLAAAALVGWAKRARFMLNYISINAEKGILPEEHKRRMIKELDEELERILCISACDVFRRTTMKETIIDWQPMETAPRDGKPFLAWCGETGREGVDTARWSGKSTTDPIGHFKTQYGWIPMAWAPMPNRPEMPRQQPYFPNRA